MHRISLLGAVNRASGKFWKNLHSVGIVINMKVSNIHLPLRLTAAIHGPAGFESHSIVLANVIKTSVIKSEREAALKSFRRVKIPVARNGKTLEMFFQLRARVKLSATMRDNIALSRRRRFGYFQTLSYLIKVTGCLTCAFSVSRNIHSQLAVQIPSVVWIHSLFLQTIVISLLCYKNIVNWVVNSVIKIIWRRNIEMIQYWNIF